MDLMRLKVGRKFPQNVSMGCKPDLRTCKRGMHSLHSLIRKKMTEFDCNDTQCMQDISGILLIDNNRVSWMTECGTLLKRTFTCNGKVTCAIFVMFPSYRNDSAIAILIDNTMLQIHFVNGGFFEMHLPLFSNFMYYCSGGIVFHVCDNLDNNGDNNGNMQNSGKFKFTQDVLNSSNNNNININGGNHDVDNSKNNCDSSLFYLSHPYGNISPIFWKHDISNDNMMQNGSLLKSFQMTDHGIQFLKCYGNSNIILFFWNSKLHLCSLSRMDRNEQRAVNVCNNNSNGNTFASHVEMQTNIVELEDTFQPLMTYNSEGSDVSNSNGLRLSNKAIGSFGRPGMSSRSRMAPGNTRYGTSNSSAIHLGAAGRLSPSAPHTLLGRQSPSYTLPSRSNNNSRSSSPVQWDRQSEIMKTLMGTTSSSSSPIVGGESVGKTINFHNKTSFTPQKNDQDDLDAVLGMDVLCEYQIPEEFYDGDDDKDFNISTTFACNIIDEPFIVVNINGHSIFLSIAKKYPLLEEIFRSDKTYMAGYMLLNPTSNNIPVLYSVEGRSMCGVIDPHLPEIFRISTTVDNKCECPSMRIGRDENDGASSLTKSISSCNVNGKGCKDLAIRYMSTHGNYTYLYDTKEGQIYTLSSNLSLKELSVMHEIIFAIKHSNIPDLEFIGQAITILFQAIALGTDFFDESHLGPVTLLLFTAFGIPLIKLNWNNSKDQNRIRGCSQLLQMASIFYNSCSRPQHINYGDSQSETSNAASILFDIIHSVLVDISIRDQSLVESISVERLATTLLLITEVTSGSSKMSHDIKRQYSDYYKKLISSRSENFVKKYILQEGRIDSPINRFTNITLPPDLYTWIRQKLLARTGTIFYPHIFSIPSAEGRLCNFSFAVNVAYFNILFRRIGIDTFDIFQTNNLRMKHWVSCIGDTNKNLSTNVNGGKHNFDANWIMNDVEASCCIILSLLECYEWTLQIDSHHLSIVKVIDSLIDPFKNLVSVVLKKCVRSSEKFLVQNAASAGQILPLLRICPPELLKLYGREDAIFSVVLNALCNVDSSRGTIPFDFIDGKRLIDNNLMHSMEIAGSSLDNTDDHLVLAGTTQALSARLSPEKVAKLGFYDDSDGLFNVEATAIARFPEDQRIREACRLLRSSRPIYLRLDRSPESNDQQHRHKLQIKLLSLCRRSLANPIGRGALTMGSFDPLLAEKLPIPTLSLSGRLVPTQSIVALDMSSAPPELTVWPEFHNGVAAGLRVLPYSDRVTRNWILHNRPNLSLLDSVHEKLSSENAHAGLLLGLGLTGMLKCLSATDICDYLTQSHEPTTVAILLGMSATFIGEADAMLSRTLCLHLPALLPPYHLDMNVSPIVQAVALAGLGLLHCGTKHRLMTEFLLAEMVRKPNTVCDSAFGDMGSNCREALSLSAGWALGMVLIGIGQSKGDNGLLDLQIESRLQYYIDGGKRPPESQLFPLTHQRANDCNSKSSKILEGDQLNTDMTAPGAIIALALMYIKSNNIALADRIAVPKTSFALDRLRPDFLIFRALAECLIMWDSVECSYNWLISKVPSIIKKKLDINFNDASTKLNKNDNSTQQHGRGEKNDDQADGSLGFSVNYSDSIQFEESTNGASSSKYSKSTYKQNNQLHDLNEIGALHAYLSITTGYCWGIGLTYAGTQLLSARDTLLHHLRILRNLRDFSHSLPSGVLNKEQENLDKMSRVAKAPTLPSLATWVNGKYSRPLLEQCIAMVAMSLGCIMAGSGDVESLRLIRELRWKADESTFGGHMAMSTAIGFLFLGGGNASFRRDSVSIATLIMAMCPRFPSRTLDNQYHIQALRHLFALAVEWRVLRVLESSKGQSIQVPISVESTDGVVKQMVAPCLLTELSSIRLIEVVESSSFVSTGSGKVGKVVGLPLCINEESEITDNSHNNGNTDTTANFSHRSPKRILPPLIVTIQFEENDEGSDTCNDRNERAKDEIIRQENTNVVDELLKEKFLEASTSATLWRSGNNNSILMCLANCQNPLSDFFLKHSYPSYTPQMLSSPSIVSLNVIRSGHRYVINMRYYLGQLLLKNNNGDETKERTGNQRKTFMEIRDEFHRDFTDYISSGEYPHHNDYTNVNDIRRKRLIWMQLMMYFNAPNLTANLNQMEEEDNNNNNNNNNDSSSNKIYKFLNTCN